MTGVGHAHPTPTYLFVLVLLVLQYLVQLTVKGVRNSLGQYMTPSIIQVGISELH